VKETEAIALLIKSGCSSNVIEHCKTVAEYARKIALDVDNCAKKRGDQINIDMNCIVIGGLLHDIGRSKTHDIDHAVVGTRIAVENGLDEKLANIIERHIGAGITMDEALVLGLPAKDYLPLTLEEKIVAHADNLVFGGSVRTINEVISNLQKKQMDAKIINRIIELNDEINSMIC
jgi:uncharacterized protein